MSTIANLNATPGNTPIHPDDAVKLIPNLSIKRELDEWEARNILIAQNWAFNSRVMKTRDPLDEIYLRELHKRMFNRTWKWAGTYRKRDLDINIGCRVAEIYERIGVLLGDARFWIEHDTFSIDETAVRFHHRLVGTIHAFPNGNGRHARLLANVIAVKHGAARFTWGRANMGVAGGPVREAYFAALHSLDNNDANIQPLLNFARS
jgi:Fic-DOC domain mobile mystery protein B